MPQKGSKTAVKERISTLKGWSRSSLGDTPLTPKPIALKVKSKTFTKKR